MKTTPAAAPKRQLPAFTLGTPLSCMKIRWDGVRPGAGGMQTLDSPRFGKTRNGGTRGHAGIDLAAPVGTPIFAIADGVIEQVRHGHPMYGTDVLLSFRPSAAWTAYLSARGVKDDDGQYFALYAHLSTVLVKKGATVKRGTLLGATGISGNADQAYPHLHFEIRKLRWPGSGDAGLLNRVDPETLFRVDFAEPFEALSQRAKVA